MSTGVGIFAKYGVRKPARMIGGLLATVTKGLSHLQRRPWFWALLLWPWGKASHLWPWGWTQHLLAVLLQELKMIHIMFLVPFNK